ncbi:hypothetical protein RRG08_033512 [Elysia crispata]|uniref:Uncharacterized protein n=1 Tax=Elysia crispata TaxID=231223 RepID=A0AAE1DH96_9GAST|nr:hypothetical protein RRG08_033512 [Elysia crispata]
MSRVGSKDGLKIYSGHEVYTSNVVYKGVLHQFCFQLSSVIGSLRPSVVFGCKGILIIFGIFQAYETQRVRLKQVNDTRCCMLLVPQSHPSSANRKTRHLI